MDKKQIEMEQEYEVKPIPLATEIISELKANSRRWFIIATAELAIILMMLVGILWYFSLPTEEYTMSQEADNQSSNMIIGGDYNGETESNIQEKGGTQ